MLSPRARAQESSEVPADEEGLRQPFGARLHGMAKREAPLAAVAEKPLEGRGVLRRARMSRIPASVLSG